MNVRDSITRYETEELYCLPIFFGVWLLLFVVLSLQLPYCLHVLLMLERHNWIISDDLELHFQNVRNGLSPFYLVPGRTIMMLSPHAVMLGLITMFYQLLLSEIRSGKKVALGLVFLLVWVGLVFTPILLVHRVFGLRPEWITMALFVYAVPIAASFLVRKIRNYISANSQSSYSRTALANLLFNRGRSNGTWLVLTTTYFGWCLLPMLTSVGATPRSGSISSAYMIVGIGFGGLILGALLAFQIARVLCGRSYVSHGIVVGAIVLMAIPYWAGYVGLRNSGQGVFTDRLVWGSGFSRHDEWIEVDFVTGSLYYDSLYWIPSLIELSIGNPVENPLVWSPDGWHRRSMKVY